MRHYIHYVGILICLTLACAHVRDPRSLTLARLDQTKARCDAAFMAFYLAKAEEVRSTVERDGGDIEQYVNAMMELNAMQAVVATIIDAATMEAKRAAQKIALKSQEPNVLFPTRRLVQACVDIAAKIGIPVTIPEGAFFNAESHADTRSAAHPHGTGFGGLTAPD